MLGVSLDRNLLIKNKEKNCFDPWPFKGYPTPTQFHVEEFCKISLIYVTEGDRKSCLVPKFSE